MRFHSFVPNRTIFSDFPVVQMGFVLWALQTVYIQCSTVQYSAGAAESVVLEHSAVCSVGVQYSVVKCGSCRECTEKAGDARVCSVIFNPVSKG